MIWRVRNAVLRSYSLPLRLTGWKKQLRKLSSKFEKWAQELRAHLGNPEYLQTASYGELRLAVRIIGIKVTVFPTNGLKRLPYQIDVADPGMMEKLYVDRGATHPSTPEG